MKIGSSTSLPLLICGWVIFLVSACSEKPVEESAPRSVLTVELVESSEEKWSDTLVASGEVAAWQEASIGTEVAGVRLERVLVNVGDMVKKGQLLAHFNEDTLRAELTQIEALVAAAEANFESARIDAQRADKLAISGAVSEQIILGYRTQALAAEARLKSARAQRDAQALRLRYARVVAPDDGVISSRSATMGTIGMVGTELFRLVRQNRLEWRAEIPADALAHLKPGVNVTLKALNGKIVTGQLRQLAPNVDTRTRSGLAYVDIPMGSGLAPGMYVTGHFALAERQVRVVPESAIVLRDGNHYLMQVDQHNRVHAIKVSTGQRQNQSIEILENLESTARFLKSGGAFVGSGDVVRITSSAQAVQ